MDAESHHHLREAYKLIGRPKARAHIKKALMPCIVKYHDLQMKLHPRDNFTEFNIWLTGNSPEEAEISWLIEQVRSRDIHFMDIGANAGIYSLRLANLIGSGSIISAFEPNPEMSRRLHKNIELNDIKNIDVHEFALSDKAGEADLFFKPAENTAQNLGEASLGNKIEGGVSIKVSTQTLANFINQRSVRAPDVIKIDVEGHEDKILLPYFRSVSEKLYPSIILMEDSHNNQWTENVTKCLSDYGYEEGFRAGRNIALSRTKGAR